MGDLRQKSGRTHEPPEPIGGLPAHGDVHRRPEALVPPIERGALPSLLPAQQRAWTTTMQRAVGNRATTDLLGGVQTACPCAASGGSCEKCAERKGSLQRGPLRGATLSLKAPAISARDTERQLRPAGGVPRSRTLFEGDDGIETLTHASPATTTADGGGAPVTTTAECSGTGANGSFSSIPNNITLPASLVGNKLGVPFDMVGDFTGVPAECSCSCGEYRQYVRGEFTKNGTTLTHALCSNTLDPTTYHEDCATVSGTDYKYGYRSIVFTNSFFDNPDQSEGCTFHGHDNPGIRGSSGDEITLNLDFRGELVDVCNSSAVLQTAEWSVAGTATVP
jgi:hypothetical protein